MFICVRNVGQWVVIVFVDRAGRAITVTGFRRVLSRMRVCALSGALLRLAGGGCRFGRRRRQTGYVIYLTRAIACDVAGGGAGRWWCVLTLLRSYLFSYLRRVCGASRAVWSVRP